MPDKTPATLPLGHKFATRTLDAADIVLACVLGGVGKRGPQVLEIQQQQARLIGGAENHREHALLDIIEFKHPGDQQRPHFRDRGADRVASLTEQVPEHRGRGGRLDLEVHGGGARQHLFVGRPDGADPGKVALYVCGEDRNAGVREALSQNLERHGLAGARRPGHEAVPVRAVEQQQLRVVGKADQDTVVGHGLILGKPAGVVGN